MIFDPLYLIITLPAIILLIYSQFKVKGTYQKYSQVRNMYNMTGAQVARRLLDAAGLSNVPVEATQGDLTDHYDPGSRVLRLSEGVYGVPSVAALGVAAHEVGHAYQHVDVSYIPMRLRAPLVPVANIGSNLGVWMAIIGIFVQASPLVLVGIVLFGAAVAFSLLTLPIELNASGRALKALQANGLVSPVELQGAKSVLSAAALTYVAATVQALLTLLYLVLRFSGMNRSDD
ncbi:MAG: zinc metallopeptidase [Bacteroidetes bacterium]|nr:zinc metallopeptidase [Bacteroidota bacterium]MCL5026095.1 zinc metallopeptidase [Chloroflexota bacterium]